VRRTTMATAPTPAIDTMTTASPVRMNSATKTSPQLTASGGADGPMIFRGVVSGGAAAVASEAIVR